MTAILTLNINGGGNRYGSWPERRPLIVDAVRESAADVVSLQAVRRSALPARAEAKSGQVQEGGPAGILRSQAHEIAELLDGYQVYYAPGTKLPDGGEEGSAILSRIPLASAAATLLSHPSTTKDQIRRLVIAAEVKTQEGVVKIFNCHFSWVPEEFERNLGDARALFESAGADPALIMGDFNAAPDEPALKLLADQGWRDVWLHLTGEEGGGLTFEPAEPSKRIDYFWANRAMLNRLAEIRLVKRGEEGGVQLSDHLGLIVELSQS